MQTNVFPQNFKTQIEEKTNMEIAAARSNCNGRIQSINNQRKSQPKGNGLGTGSMLGFFGGFIACSCVCINDVDATWSAIVTWIFICVFSSIIGYLYDKGETSSYKEMVNDIEFRISRENDNLEQEIKEIQERAQREQKEYLEQFEKNAQDMSVQFAESELAREVIEWMTKGFFKTIDAADRRSHIERVEVPFVFNILIDKITCNLGTYDFELNRCRNLNNPLEQTALARAIASAIQLNVIIKYPKDDSGTEISITIQYSYTNDYPATTITYIAPNGNYKEVRGW